jgi:hypothetical protein
MVLKLSGVRAKKVDKFQRRTAKYYRNNSWCYLKNCRENARHNVEKCTLKSRINAGTSISYYAKYPK